MISDVDIQGKAKLVFERRLFVSSEDLIQTQDFDNPHTLDGGFCLGPFPNMPMDFRFENVSGEDLTVEILASFDYDNRDRNIGITGGNVEVTEDDATTQWTSMSTDLVVPGGRKSRIIDWATETDSVPPDALRLRISVGTGTLLANIHAGVI